MMTDKSTTRSRRKGALVSLGGEGGAKRIGDARPGMQITPELMKDADTAIKLDTLPPTRMHAAKSMREGTRGLFGK